jgi:hypothetical protein
VGGESETGAALAGGEFATLTRTGDLGAWRPLPHALPEGRTGVRLVRAGRFVYALGGSSDGSTPLATQSVLRAHILGTDSAPVLTLPTTGTGGSLAAGTYYYRVSAVMAPGTVNAGGESLPSDFESVRVNQGGTVTLTWSMPQGAPAVSSYRIYRSPDPNMLSGTEVLLDTTTDTTFTDNGSATPGTQVPLAQGGLGVWMPVAELNTPRFDHGATSVRLGPDSAFLYVSGGRRGSTSNDVLVETEWAALSADGSDIVGAWQNGPNLAQKRAEHVMRPVSHALAESIPAGTFGVVAVGGFTCARAATSVGCSGLNSIESSAIDTTEENTGRPVGWSSGGSLSGSRVGHTGIVVNNTMYAFNGWTGTGGAFANASELSSTTTCVGPAPCYPAFSGFTAATVSFPTGVQYRSTVEFFGAFFYFVGGSAGLPASSTSNAVVRGGY